MIELRHVERPSLHALAAGIALALVVGSLLPKTGQMPATPVPIGFDKLLHFGGYSAFAGVLAAARNARSSRALAGVVLTAFALGFGLELAQANLPTRTLSLEDALANGLGALGGVTGWLLSRRL